MPITRRDGAALVIRTQGDANTSPDPWTLRVQERRAYLDRFTIPIAGYPSVWLHSSAGRRGLPVPSGTLVIVVDPVFGESRRRRRR
ncbi:MAG: S24/S26 family peptidase [Acidimicrobiales bacterium]